MLLNAVKFSKTLLSTYYLFTLQTLCEQILHYHAYFVNINIQSTHHLVGALLQNNMHVHFLCHL